MESRERESARVREKRKRSAQNQREQLFESNSNVAHVYIMATANKKPKLVISEEELNLIMKQVIELIKLIVVVNQSLMYLRE